MVEINWSAPHWREESHRTTPVMPLRVGNAYQLNNKAVPTYSISTMERSAWDWKHGQSQLTNDSDGSKLSGVHFTLFIHLHSPHLDRGKVYKSPRRTQATNFIHPNSSLASCRYLVLSAFHLSK